MEVIVMYEKKDVTSSIPDELHPGFKPEQVVRVIANGKKMFSSGSDDEISWRYLTGRIGIVNSITGFGNPISRYEIGVVFSGDAEDISPTKFYPEELEHLGAKKRGGNLHEK
jgi:hypothetical protein